MYSVFSDFHHAGLLHSLIMLFEDRLGGNLYRPIGTDWHTQGFWKVYDHPATVQQFLGIGGATPDGTPPLNEVAAVTPPPDPLYYCHDIDSGTTNKAITLQGFLNRKIDFVIASIPDHIAPFKKLCGMHPNKPKLIYQVGNVWDLPAELTVHIDAIMASARIGKISDKPYIEYHQEFDLNIFKPVPDQQPELNIASFVNCFGVEPMFDADYRLFNEVQQLLPDYKMKVYGGQCRDGAVGPSTVLADTMRTARFIWHTKNGGDGYGHIIHNAPAVGRPLLVKKQYYSGKIAEPLLVDGVTCVAIDNMGAQEIANKIRFYENEERYSALCTNAYNNFKTIVDFDKEAMQINAFLHLLN